MNRKFLLALWGGLFVSCAGLGFVHEPQGVLKWLMILLGLVFFAPPVMLLADARERKDVSMAALVRSIAAGSLILTLVALVANFLSLLGSVTLGDVLNAVLAIVSVPMYCSQIWILSIFCWAFLMIGAHQLVKQMKKTQA